MTADPAPLYFKKYARSVKDRAKQACLGQSFYEGIQGNFL